MNVVAMQMGIGPMELCHTKDDRRRISTEKHQGRLRHRSSRRLVERDFSELKQFSFMDFDS